MKNKKSTKKFSIIAPIVFGATMTSLGLVALGTTLTSCGQKSDINLKVTGDAHYKSYTTRGTLRKDSTFFIIPTFENNYTIDPATTTITCGNTKLVQGTDYTINTNMEIMVNPNKITTTDVEVFIGTSSKIESFSQEWVEGKGIDYYGNLFLAVGETLTTSDVKVFANLYDKTKKQLNWGSGFNEVQFLYNGNDITDEFIKHGFTIDEDMMEIDPQTQKKKITQVNIKFSVTTLEGKAGSQTMSLFAGYAPSFINMKETSGATEFKVGQTYYFETTGLAGAFNAGKFELTKGTQYATIDEDGTLKCTAAGDIAIQVTAYYDTTKTATKYITIVA